MEPLSTQISPVLALIGQVNLYTDRLVDQLRPKLQNMVICEMRIRQLEKEEGAQLQEMARVLEMLRADRIQIFKILKNNFLFEE